jgi:hypothetical protein
MNPIRRELLNGLFVLVVAILLSEVLRGTTQSSDAAPREAA